MFSPIGQGDEMLGHDRIVILIDLAGLDTVPAAKKTLIPTMIQYHLGIYRVLICLFEVPAKPDRLAVA